MEHTAASIQIDWDKVVREMVTTPTLQVVVNPPLRRGSTIHDRAFEELRKLGADYVRFVPWFPYPRLAIGELQPPADGKTSWDFSLIDPLMIDFLEATLGHSPIPNFSTIPPWMFKIDKPVVYPDNPDEPTWFYQLGSELRDPSLKELSEYFARLIAWYTAGGFEDEYGVRHESGYYYPIDWWEVFNEIDLEHDTTPDSYTARYDAIVTAIRRVAPQMKFIGLSVAFPRANPRYFEYFLNPANHKPGIPLDMISYHFYASPAPDETFEVQQHTYFAQADDFMTAVRYIEAIRLRLSPSTRTTVNELGSIRAEDSAQSTPGFIFQPIPDAYWNLSGAVFAYVFAQLALLGIDIAGESQLVGYPTQFPSVSMLDWNTGAPNARFRVLELLKNHFAPGDVIIRTNAGMFGSPPYFHAQAFQTRAGQNKLLLVSKRYRPIDLALPGFEGATAQVVDQATAGGPARSERISGDLYTLPGLAVAVLTLP